MKPDITDILNAESQRISAATYRKAMSRSPFLDMLPKSDRPIKPPTRLQLVQRKLRLILSRIKDALAVLCGTKEARDTDDWD